MTQHGKRDEIELFLQGEGIRDIALMRVPRDGTARDIIEAARALGLSAPSGAETLLLVEDSEEPLALDAPLEAAGIAHRGRVHVHRCRRVAVTVNFNADQNMESFPPSTTMARVKRWAVGKHGFGLSEIDAAEHLLQVCGSTDRPDEDVHIGALVTAPACGLCFDLVAKQRVEG
ncbi:MAG: hypothetical protein IT340_22385 [Chloroflexi bacterium]|nr:hypothetical protein [Chloroflexota bacterium]